MVYAFGIFEFDAETGELRRAGRLVALEPQPARTLGFLLGSAGEIVSREQLAGHVWGSDTHVDFNRGLAYCVAEIRRALGDSAESPRYIQTLPKRGFRFVAPVQSRAVSLASQAFSAIPSPGDATGSTGLAGFRALAGGRRRAAVAAAAAFAAVALVVGVWTWRGPAGPARPVVAVSVFDNETGDSRFDLPVRVLSDTVVDRLTGLGPERIGVVGNVAALRMPRSERDLKKIAAETKASFVILAQLQRIDGELSLLIHLIRLDDGTHVWTRRIAPPGEELAGLDDEAARMVEAAAQRFVIRES